jgi:hypothetical protein
MSGYKEREPHIAEGTLEMQKWLLQKLAKRENMIKGYQSGKHSINGKEIPEVEEGSEHCSTTIASLEEWKREMAQALHMIWGPRIS